MIEILVTVLLLSIGFLATAQMQIQGLRFSQSAYYRSQAYLMASDIMDRMRGNSDGVLTGAYTDKMTTAGLTDPQCHANYCDAAKQAEQDLFDWSAKLHNLNDTENFLPILPGNSTYPAKGQIVQQANGVFTITVSWIEKIDSEDQQQQLILEFVPWI